ncbi:bacteriocin secretion accessory protein [Bifidobacterium oedipodis]|uniref:Competence-stimulating peptide ABC transporter permease protein ComB n=1 Tax=Bifidobacterium oedipodis TaxID=2675322 RepID=A0A7Y0HT58_9BIFI|nr:bacteriocin secretion accessory protein [Bifidobacterium sp. DSM 109957]NMM94726.1 Competence-stimulating peptide ABC transporter permease protein ComB [Bifidobacterium sp. DSM 109957]
MDSRLFESSEYYSRRYRNFSTMVIMPVLAIVVGLLAFSLIGTREITVKTVGEIVPSRTVTRIQSTSNKPITVNHVEENREVHKGDLLLAYDSAEDDTQLEALRQQLEVADQQHRALERLIAGLNDDTGASIETDEFGYSAMLDDFHARVDALRRDAATQYQSTADQNAAIATVQASVDEQIVHAQQLLDDYAQLRQAVASDGVLPDDNAFIASYATYQAQANATTDAEQKTTLQNQTLADIDSSVRELNESIASLRTQRASAGSITAQSSSLDSQIEALQAQYQLNADKELATVQSKQLELKTSIALAQGDTENLWVEATANGVLHVNEEVKGLKQIPAGTTVAEVYPKLTDGTQLDVMLMVPVSEITEIRKGQGVRLSNYQNSAKPLILEATVRSIALSPTRTEQGNYYEVRASVVSKPGQSQYLRYGFQGETVIITGKKPYLAYYWDKLVHP